MVVAPEIDRVGHGVYTWHAYDPAVKCDLWSTALATPDGLVVIDPIELAPEALSELIAEHSLAAIMLTSGNHARAAERWKARHGAPIWATSGAAHEFGFRVDREFSENDAIPGGMRAVALPAAGPGEVALLSQDVLCFGDAVINFGSSGFSILPAKYCANAVQLPNELRKLLSYDARILTFAHGDPIVTHAKERLLKLLA